MWGSLNREAEEWAILELLKFVFSPTDTLASQNIVFLTTVVCLWYIIRLFSSKPAEASVLKISEKSRRQITVLWKLIVSTHCRDSIHLLSLLHNECENICWSPKYASCLKFNSGRRQKIERIGFWGMKWKLEREAELWAARISKTSDIYSSRSQISPTGFSYKICKFYFRCKIQYLREIRSEVCLDSAYKILWTVWCTFGNLSKDWVTYRVMKRITRQG
jgi:hypothetical protein